MTSVVVLLGAALVTQTPLLSQSFAVSEPFALGDAAKVNTIKNELVPSGTVQNEVQAVTTFAWALMAQLEGQTWPYSIADSLFSQATQANQLVSWCRNLIKLHPKSGYANYALGSAIWAQSTRGRPADLAEAEKSFKAAVNLAPGLGVAKRRLQDLRDVRRMLNR